MNCINRNLPEFKNLQKELGVSNFETDAIVANWQEDNGLDRFPTTEEALNWTTETKEFQQESKSLPNANTALVEGLIDETFKSDGEKYLEYALKNKEEILEVFNKQGNKFITYNEYDDPISVQNHYSVNPFNFNHKGDNYTAVFKNNEYSFFKNGKLTSTEDYYNALNNYETGEDIKVVSIEVVEVLNKEDRNKGYGISRYILAGEEALENGAFLVSDRTKQVSHFAQKVWNTLVKVGLAVEDAPLSYRYTGLQNSEFILNDAPYAKQLSEIEEYLKSISIKDYTFDEMSFDEAGEKYENCSL